VQLLKSCAATERERILKQRMREDIDERFADYKILLDLDVFNPGGVGAPFSYVVARNHRSGSTSVLTSSFHSFRRCAFDVEAPGTSGAYSRACSWTYS